MIRDSEPEDMDQILPLMKEVFDKSILKSCAYSPAEASRNFAVLSAMDHGYSKVYVEGDRILGLLVGVVSPNQWGVKCAQDMFTYSRGGTHLLIKDFCKWAKRNGAEFVNITDFSESERYHSLIQSIGLKKQGTVFIGGI